MWEIIMEGVVKIAVALLLMLIGVCGTYLTQLLARKAQLSTIREAVEHAVFVTQQTVGELQQTIVEGLKAAHEDGKLTPDEVAGLKQTLLIKTKEKLGPDIGDILSAAGVDVTALITGAAEEWIGVIKKE